MPYKTDFDQFLADLPSTARPLVQRLKADSDQLHSLTDYSDPGEAVSLLSVLGEALIRYAGDEDVTGHVDGKHRVDQLAGLFSRIGEGLSYHQRITALKPVV